MPLFPLPALPASSLLATGWSVSMGQHSCTLRGPTKEAKEAVASKGPEHTFHPESSSHSLGSFSGEAGARSLRRPSAPLKVADARGVCDTEEGKKRGLRGEL